MYIIIFNKVSMYFIDLFKQSNLSTIIQAFKHIEKIRTNKNISPMGKSWNNPSEINTPIMMFLTKHKRNWILRMKINP